MEESESESGTVFRSNYFEAKVKSPLNIRRRYTVSDADQMSPQSPRKILKRSRNLSYISQDPEPHPFLLGRRSTPRKGRIGLDAVIKITKIPLMKPQLH
jgi:hypothetical protein